ncbi:uncharacterized protein LOC116307119 [Actinia tenebrosa]|uniref:Uncharacterized protein LOC116307119 n=1 Tax=Actinia tenebrosa TaxID=6105 RepID=A0A6P8J0X2_ACTTE|nr:uncharacterized protein LOC116307119 [Actinia tenebrosa]
MIGLFYRRKFFFLLATVIGMFIYTILSKDYLNIQNYQVQSYAKRDDNKEAVDENEEQKSSIQSQQVQLDSQSQTSTNPALANEPDLDKLPSSTDSPTERKDQKGISDNWLQDDHEHGWNIDTPSPLMQHVNSDPSVKEEAQQNGKGTVADHTNNFSTMADAKDMVEFSNADQERKTLDNSINESFFDPNALMFHDNNNLEEHQSQAEQKLDIQNKKKILKTLLNDEPNSHLLPFSICPFLGIRESKVNPWLNDSLNEVRCRPKTPSEKACKEAYMAYNVHLSPLTCEKQGIANEICNFKEDGTIECDMSPCTDNYVYLSGVDPDYGIVTNDNTAFLMKSNKELERLVYDYSKSSSENGFNFCFLKCKCLGCSTTSLFLEQLIIFQPKIPNGPLLELPLINFNIITLDSVSRAHFYRSLPKTVEVLRRIVHDPRLEATVLDFELFQSMADYTFHNIRTLMSGKTDSDYKAHKKQHYEIEYLFSILKSKGYHTLLQEDSCWYDEWGSLYTDNLFQGKQPQNLEDFSSRWKTFKKQVEKYYIDDFGLSHFSCKALQRYNITNQFNRPKKICFGGKVFAEYFLDYNEKVFKQKRTSKTPIFAHTHLNTGHEISGTRIKQLDQRLSEFFLNMAGQENTLTLVLSDHGPKTTTYAFRTMDGRAEIYDALLFAILPEKTASFLGYHRTKALITNQKRLLTTLELHHTLVSIGNLDKENSGSTQLEGIFAEIPSNRSCSDISMRSAAVCKCDGWEKTFSTNHPSLTWLAELALGTLNNRIQTEFMENIDSWGGFGNCQRLAGKTFEKIRRRSVGDNYLVTMDLIVIPESEIFEVQIEYPKIPRQSNNNVTLTHLSRISIYRRFDTCKDDTVNLTICVCKSRKYSSYGNRQWIKMDSRKHLLKILARSKNFGAKVKFTDLHANCLVMITRTHSARTSAFEIANACSDRSYKIKVSGKSRGQAIVSSPLPLILTVEPLTAHFLFSVYHLERPYGFKATTSYKAYFIED